jgi:hypothetical protein
MRVRPRFAFIRDKIQVFLLGLLLGLVLGGGFFVLKLDQYVKELSFYKSLTEDKKDKNDLGYIPPKVDSPKPVVKPHKKDLKNPDLNNSVITDNSNLDDTGQTSVYVGNNTDDNIVVRKDEMLGQKTYSVASVKTKNASDSSAQNEISPGNVDIEFWLSPLNYHGYKFSRNKLVLFGYSENDLVSVMKVDNSIFLKCLTGVFRIDPSADFRQMDRVTDETLLAKLK